jgi:hypothetical protein
MNIGSWDKNTFLEKAPFLTENRNQIPRFGFTLHDDHEHDHEHDQPINGQIRDLSLNTPNILKHD